MSLPFITAEHLHSRNFCCCRYINRDTIRVREIKARENIKASNFVVRVAELKGEIMKRKTLTCEMELMDIAVWWL